jgi:hypothetical protein
MYIEDIIDHVVGFSSWMNKGTPPLLSPYDNKLLNSFSDQINRGSGLTEKQAVAVERILRIYSGQISAYIGTDVGPYINAPKYKLGKRVISQEKSVKIKETENYGKIMSVMFPYDEGLVALIKDYRKHYLSKKAPSTIFTNYSTIDWNSEDRTWNFHLYEEHVDWVYQNFKPLGFVFDQEIEKIYKEIEIVKNSMDTYVPMVVYEENSFKFVNIHKNIPQPTSTDVLEVLFQAKKYGISTWDNTIESALNDKSINHFTRKLICENSGIDLPKNGEKLVKEDLLDIIQYMNNLLVTIPGGSELDTLKYFHNFMKELGITDEDMSVLFRLDSSSGAICNEYVKENKLNNPISEKIKIFFISGKVPKPLICSGIEFDAIINLGSNSAHYTQKNLVKNHHCVINYTIERERWDKNYAGV